MVDHAVVSKENMGKMKVNKSLLSHTLQISFKFEIFSDSIRRHMTETKEGMSRGRRAQQRRRLEDQQRSRRNWILSRSETLNRLILGYCIRFEYAVYYNVYYIFLFGNLIVFVRILNLYCICIERKLHVYFFR